MNREWKIDYFVVMENNLNLVSNRINKGLELRGLDASSIINVLSKENSYYIIFYKHLVKIEEDEKKI